ncbi:methyltransferase domain-containing protein [Lacibacter sp. H407]|uniref:methyltransferase domain-containing protein n=1 Tax=Lacibacter sp. H407 TaxID=3133423 RepID=UPI0030BC26ED
MTREEKLLYKIDKTLLGVEIGPSHNPIAPKKSGFNVHIIDHMNKDELIKKYKDHNVDLSNIEEVDFVWKGESYSELTRRSKSYSWILASHVIEHTPDIISFLNECDAILKENGVLSLAIPDVRYCFDYFRPITGVSKVIDAYLHKNKIHTPGTAAEYFLNFAKRDGNISWFEGYRGELALEFSIEDAYNQMNAVIRDKIYLDLHSWCFTPTSFRLLIQDLNSLGLINLKEVSFFPSEGCEFFIKLSREGTGYLTNRIDALKTIKAELSI